MSKISRKKELLDNMLREEIATTVMELISQEKPVTMDLIAAKCEVAKGTLYNYFKNKKELIDYVHKTIIIPKIEQDLNIFQSEKSPTTKLHEFVDSVFGLQEVYPRYFQFLESQRTQGEADREKFKLVINPLIRLCEEGIQTGEFVDLDAFVMGSMIFGTVIGPLQMINSGQENTQDMERIKQNIVRLLDRILLAQQEKA